MSVGALGGKLAWPESISVGLGQSVIGGAGDGTWVIHGLGSCIGLILCDRERRVAAMAHIVLPKSSVSTPPDPPKYADTAIPFLLHGLRKHGISEKTVIAQIAGGARMLQLKAMGDIGQRNAAAVRASLQDYGISIVAACVGGTAGRTLRWDRKRGIATVSQVGKEDVVLTPNSHRFVDVDK